MKLIENPHTIKELHEWMEIPENSPQIRIRRVPGGWIYQQLDGFLHPMDSGVFVPFNQEFSPDDFVLDKKKDSDSAG